MISARPSNFSHLKAHDEQLVRLGLLAERYFPEDPNTSLLKLRQLSELLAQLIATHVGLYASPDEKQVDLVRRLQDQGIVPREVEMLFTRGTQGRQRRKPPPVGRPSDRSARTSTHLAVERLVPSHVQGPEL